MHAPLLSRIFLLLVQFLLLTMALPIARQQHNAPRAIDLPERDAEPAAEAIATAEPSDSFSNDAAIANEKRTSNTVPFGKRIAITKPGPESLVRAVVRSPDRRG
ncbi:hypothetical protein MMC20_006601 [Loxospora ochrophaea]|nr:hypothetical protein [Loxospora ochrophaea]